MNSIINGIRNFSDTLKSKLQYALEDFVKIYETDENIRNILNISMALEGMPRQASTHACRNSYNKRSC